jgi:bifunctional DNA-binding transcriptional regulator/antitoxin component of YhaV-PrlF toxin-antitoxin module
MQQIVSITSQGQISIPKLMLQDLGIYGATKAVAQKVGNTIVVSPKRDFWSLAGSLKSKIKLSDRQLKDARESFSKNWAQNE